MEMLLWFYSYDKRFLFNLNLPIWMLIFLWIIPIIINLLICLLYLYFFYKKNYGTDLEKCLNDFYWLNPKKIMVIELAFTFLIPISAVAFLSKLIKSYQKSKKESNKISDMRNGKEQIQIYEDDYLTYHSEAMEGAPSKILFFLSLFHYIFMIIFLFKEADFCDSSINSLFYKDTLYQIIPFSLILCIFAISFIIKLTFFGGSYLCPSCVKKLATCTSSNKQLRNLLNFEEKKSEEI